MYPSIHYTTILLSLFLIGGTACSSSSTVDNVEPDPVVASPQLQDQDGEPDDLERLRLGLKRLVALSLIDLNQALTSGEILSSQQSDCLGSFESGRGEPLSSFDCAGAPLLAPTNANTVRLSINRAAFFSTQTCHADLLIGRTDNCELHSAEVSISTEWVIPEPPQRPYPIAGLDMNYSVAESILSIDSLEGTPSEPFSCKIDLSTAEPPDASADCDFSVALAADRLDVLVP